MVVVTELLADLFQAGVQLWVHDGQLHYETAQGSLTPEQIADLRAAKADVMTALLELQNADRHPIALIPRSGTDTVPLTIQQEWFWRAIQKYPTSNCLETYAWRLYGALNVHALRASLNEVVRRHEALRTRFVVIDGAPRQQIDPPSEIPLPIVPCADQSQQTGEERARHAVEEMSAQFMDLSTGPLLQARLLKLSENDHVFALIVHHILIDASAQIILFRELWTLYSELAAGRIPSLKEMPIQYADYAVWQRRTHLSRLRRQGNYWRTRLARASPARFEMLDGSENGKFCNRKLEVAFGEPLSTNLRSLARRERTTSAMLVLAIYATVIARSCDQRDFVILFTTTGRHCSAHENMIGFLVWWFPLRIELTGEETYLDTVTLVTREFFAALENLDFGMVLDQRPGLMRGTLLQVDTWDSSDLTGTRMPSGWETLQPPLTVESFLFKPFVPDNVESEIRIALGVMAGQQGMTAHLHYGGPDRIAEQWMHRFAQELQLVAEDVVRRPDRQWASYDGGACVGRRVDAH